MVIMTAPTGHQADKTGTCPLWCAYGPHRSFGEIHSTQTQGVPTASPEHFCGYTTGPDAEGPTCGATIDATLSAYDGNTWISVSHGDDYLPAMSVDAAEQLARSILALVYAARNV
jgi:hypothetical protein